MASVRSTKGCHTCRVRKKKCDEQHPVCSSCISRSITCYGYGPKPTWMDGGAREDEMTRGIRKAAEKNYRERRKPCNKMGAKNRGMKDIDLPDIGMEIKEGEKGITKGQILECDGMATGSDYRIGPERLPILIPRRHTPVLPAKYSPGGIASQPRSRAGVVKSAAHPKPFSARPSRQQTLILPMHPLFWDSGLCSYSATTRSSQELGLLMHYMDIVFPLQFGFFRRLCPVPDHGRSWLLQVVLRLDSMYHASLCLGILHQEQLRLGSSLIEAPKDMARNHAMSLKGMKESIDAMNTEELGVDLWTMAWEVLACMIHLLSIEVFRDIAGHWELHLSAARTLLSMLSSKLNPSVPDFTSEDLLAHILLKTPSPHASFFLACFLWVDILAQAVGLSPPPPANLNYLFLISPRPSDPHGPPLLDLRTMLGCENWAMACVVDISDLAAWKKARLESTSAAVLSTTLDRRAATIRDALEIGIERTQKSIRQDGSIDADIAIVTSLFALAALTYLAVVVAGPRPAHPTVRAAIARTLPALEAVPRRLMIRLSWPVCVTGCMAAGEGERQAIWRAIGRRGLGKVDEGGGSKSRNKEMGTVGVSDLLEEVVKMGKGEDENSGTLWKGMRVVEECWRVHDAGQEEFGWEESMKALGLRILSC